MAELVANCPRCGVSKMTFDIFADVYVGLEFGWKSGHEVFARCRECNRPSIFLTKLRDQLKGIETKKDTIISKLPGAISELWMVVKPITVSDVGSRIPPDYLPAEVELAFTEGARSLSAGNFNAAGAMFRAAIDLTTKNFLPDVEDADVTQPNKKQRYDLGPRLDWLFENGVLPKDLASLAKVVREHGKDGVHDASLTATDAADMEDFCYMLLERIYTEPGRVAAAEARRIARRSN